MAITAKLKVVKGTKVSRPTVTIEQVDGRLFFTKAPFQFKDHIKAMRGWRWHGFDKEPRKVWSIEDCYRNQFQLMAMMGQPVFEPWERAIVEHEFSRPLFPHQEEMANFALTRKYCNLAVDRGLGKTLAMFEVIEQSPIKDWWWVAPGSGVRSLHREIKKWNLSTDVRLNVMSYEMLFATVRDQWPIKKVFPQGVIFDESSRLKNPEAKRTESAQAVADMIRHEYGWDGSVITMSGTTTSQRPTDIWSQIEITWPGFLKEGSFNAFRYRLCVFKKNENSKGDTYHSMVTWRDDERKCNVCGAFKEKHPIDGCKKWVRSVNEVALLPKRLQGIQLIQRKEDCLDLPEKRFRLYEIEPDKSILRAARAMALSAPNTITGLNWLRQLSDGFAYTHEAGDEEITCPVCCGSGEAVIREEQESRHDPDEVEYYDRLAMCEKCFGTGLTEKIVKKTKRVECPKDEALREILRENDEHGRIVVCAGFQGAVDRCMDLCLSEGWSVVIADGRGWKVKNPMGTRVKDDPLDFWADPINRKVAFVMHPKTGGMGLTLVEAHTVVYYSLTYSSDDWLQSQDRVHRIGCDMNRGVELVILIHLPSDRKVYESLQSNQRLEEMSLGNLDFGEIDG